MSFACAAETKTSGKNAANIIKISILTSFTLTFIRRQVRLTAFRCFDAQKKGNNRRIRADTRAQRANILQLATHENSYFNAFFMRRLEIVKIPFGLLPPLRAAESTNGMIAALPCIARAFFLSSVRCIATVAVFGYELCKTIVVNKFFRTNGTGGYSWRNGFVRGKGESSNGMHEGHIQWL